MVGRKGIGAAAASALIFSVLLASNFLVFEASQGRSELYLKSDAADSLADRAGALAGAGATDVLLQAQSFLGSSPLGCSSALAAAGSEIGGIGDLQRSGELTVDVSARLVQVSSPDNLSMVAPFEGGSTGEVDISLKVSMSANESAAGVSLNKVEVHVVHLPVRLEKLRDDCLAAVGWISQAISATSNCTEQSAARSLESAAMGAALTAHGDGFAFGLSYTVVDGATCGVDYTVSVAQEGVQGPGGAFSVRLQESGSSAFEQPASRQQG